MLASNEKMNFSILLMVMMITSHDHYGRETGLHILLDVLDLELAQYRILQGRCYDFFNRHHKCRV